MSFELATAGRIVFGAGTAEQVPALVRSLGCRLLLVAGRPRGEAAVLERRLEAESLVASRLTIVSEPSVEQVREGVRQARSASCDVVVGLGGGSSIDMAKAVAALASNPGDPLDYLEVIGAGRALAHPSLPVIAVPTTAGSGAEVTRNAVLTSREHGVKASLRSPFLLPRAAVVDPRLTLDLPPSLTAATGLDALAQLIEPYLSRRANPFTDALCREGVPRVSAWLAIACEDGGRLDARENLSLASLFGGLALANAGLGAVHGFAGPLGGRFTAPHGALCAALLPSVMRVNLAVARGRGAAPTVVSPPAARDAAASDVPARMTDVARWLSGNAEARAEDGIEWLEALCARLGVRPLGAFGMTASDIPALVAQSRASSSMRGNPVELNDEELAEILRRAL